MMVTDRWPRGLRKGIVYGSAVLALTSYIVWERSKIPDPPVKKFQGGIAQPEVYSDPSPLPSAMTIEEEEPRTETSGSLVITVVDQNGSGVAGIPVVITGPVDTALQTDERGRIRLQGPAGYYSFRIDEGCTDTAQVSSGATGQGGIAAGRSGTGNLQILWRNRYRPWVPSFASSAPFWMVGEIVDVGFYVVDRCRSNARAPMAAYPTFAFFTSPTLEIVGTPVLKADGAGHGHLKVRCLSAGRVSLTATDTKNRSDDAMDLLLENVSAGGQSFECRAPDQADGPQVATEAGS